MDVVRLAVLVREPHRLTQLDRLHPRGELQPALIHQRDLIPCSMRRGLRVADPILRSDDRHQVDHRRTDRRRTDVRHPDHARDLRTEARQTSRIRSATAPCRTAAPPRRLDIPSRRIAALIYSGRFPTLSEHGIAIEIQSQLEEIIIARGGGRQRVCEPATPIPFRGERGCRIDRTRCTFTNGW